MYATAHRVVSQANVEAVNAFLHLHGPSFVWPTDASGLPEESPGRLVSGPEFISTPPGGNAVRSYLDVLAPDGTPLDAIERVLAALARDLPERRNPTVFVSGDVTVRFGVEFSLEGERGNELGELFRVIRSLLGGADQQATR